MRLIDADEIRMARVPYDEELSEYERGWNDACDAVAENAPTIDAVPVVRCKDCKWWNQPFCDKFFDAYIRKAEWFCADGEKRDQ